VHATDNYPAHSLLLPWILVIGHWTVPDSGRDSSVSITSRLQAEQLRERAETSGRGSVPGILWRTNPHGFLFPGIKRPELEADKSCPSVA
jgi:hypothetical protein